jgi:hypothetical protein
MHAVFRTLLASCAAFASVQAVGNGGDHQTSARHQLMACMTKAMSASKTISYNQASKLCKQQLQTPAMASTAATKPAGGMGR